MVLLYKNFSNDAVAVVFAKRCINTVIRQNEPTVIIIAFIYYPNNLLRKFEHLFHPLLYPAKKPR